ncbi:MAG: phosphopentomutase, partial [Candidatus Eisenbacteria bacterium]|nr:phosphopentomutase [Candidatus Eisenbacteria bacterium]
MRVVLIVLDGVGIGALPDAADYGDEGSHTLRHVAEAVGGLRLPTLERLGLGCIEPLRGVPARVDPRAAYGRMAERSPGKDSTTGHWEIAGLVQKRAFPTYPNGFPPRLLEAWCERTGRGWLGNVAASGTEIIARLGEEHQRTGKLIVYTSADSVFQVAAHETTVPLDQLYAACGAARGLLAGEHAVGRVIARPFEGAPGSYKRTTNRRDFSLVPPHATLLDRVVERGEPVITVGKVDDLFAGRGVTDALHTKDNSEGEEILLDLLRRPGRGLVFANLVDFDQAYGHRNDPVGFGRALEQFDDRCAELLSHLRDDEILIVTADHGNDPTTPSTDHSREYVPLLVSGPRVRAGRALGTRETFADLGATIVEFFGAGPLPAGESFLRE